MLLYHFTTRRYLDSILADGLNQGGVELSATETINGVWLTTSREPVGIGRLSGGIPSAAQKIKMAQIGMISWDMLNAPLEWPDKREVRITVKLARADRRLVRWDNWSRKHTDPRFRAGLIATDGDGHKGWHVYFGVIPPESFAAVEHMPITQKLPTCSLGPSKKSSKCRLNHMK